MSQYSDILNLAIEVKDKVIAHRAIEEMRVDQLAIQDQFGYTVLHEAAHQGRIEIALALIEKMSPESLELKDLRGYTALGLAIEYGRTEIVQALIEKTSNIEKKCNRGYYYDLMPLEFNDVRMVLEMGAKKYGAHDWEKEEGAVINHKNNHESMFRHLAESSSGVTQDKESGLHPLLHLATRALMGYTRHVRGLK